MMSVIGDIARDLKTELVAQFVSPLNGGIAGGIKEQVEILDRLVREGKLDEAHLTWEKLQATLADFSSGAGALFSSSSLLTVKSLLQERITSRLDGLLRPGLLRLLGPLGGPLASLGIMLLRDLLGGHSYRRSNLQELITPVNRELITRVMAFCAKVEDRHRALPGSDPGTLRTRAALSRSFRAARDRMVSEVLSAPNLDVGTKKEIFYFSRQWHLLTPGQRNLAQELAEQCAVLAPGAGSDLGFDALFSHADAEPAPVTVDLTPMAPKFVAGLGRLYSGVWSSWYPRDVGREQHLQHDLVDLLTGEDRADFMAFVQSRTMPDGTPLDPAPEGLFLSETPGI